MAGSSKSIKLRLGPILSQQPIDIMKDSWDADQERSFVDMLLEEASRNGLRDDPFHLVRRLNVMSEKLFQMHGRRFHLSTMRQKLEQLRQRCKDFGEFKQTPGVVYLPKYFSCTVSAKPYWNHVKKERSTFTHMRLNDCSIEDILEKIFNDYGVAELPEDPEGGSPLSPIVLKDDNGGNRMVPFADQRQPNFEDSDEEVAVVAGPPAFRVRENARRGNYRSKLTARMRSTRSGAAATFEGKEIVSEEEPWESDDDSADDTDSGMFGGNLWKMD